MSCEDCLFMVRDKIWGGMYKLWMLKFKISYWDLLEIFKFFSELLWFYSPNFLFLLLLFADDLVWLFGNQIWALFEEFVQEVCDGTEANIHSRW